MNIENARALITGAAGGIGSSLARRMAASGARLLLTDLRVEGLDELAKDLRRTGADVVTVAADVTTDEGRNSLAARARIAGVDVLLNLAGVNPFGLFAEQAPADIGRTLLINTCAPMLLCQALIPVLARSADAHIVNVGSTFGSIGYPGFCVYSASKFAVRGFTEALRRELADTSIRVHYVAPRATRTALSTDRVRAMNEELGIAMDSPETVAVAIERTLRRAHRATYLGLPERISVLLNAVFPGLVDRAVRKQLPAIRRHAARGATAAHGTDSSPVSLRV